METLTLHKAKDTKNKVVYGTKDSSVIQSVYIDKDALRELVDYRDELLNDAEWRYQERLQQLKLSQETSATLARPLPESAGAHNTGRTLRRRWWKFAER